MKSVGTITIIMKELSILSERSKKTPTVFKVNKCIEWRTCLTKKKSYRWKRKVIKEPHAGSMKIQTKKTEAQIQSIVCCFKIFKSTKIFIRF